MTFLADPHYGFGKKVDKMAKKPVEFDIHVLSLWAS
jgi:hypothetical protein